MNEHIRMMKWQCSDQPVILPTELGRQHFAQVRYSRPILMGLDVHSLTAAYVWEPREAFVIAGIRGLEFEVVLN